MDVFVTRDEQCFVWNSEKAKANQKKHGVSFERGIDAIIDPYAVFEDAGADQEEGQVAIGMDLLRRLLYVVHIERDGGFLRLISATLANGARGKAI